MASADADSTVQVFVRRVIATIVGLDVVILAANLVSLLNQGTAFDLVMLASAVLALVGLLSARRLSQRGDDVAAIERLFVVAAVTTVAVALLTESRHDLTAIAFGIVVLLVGPRVLPRERLDRWVLLAIATYVVVTAIDALAPAYRLTSPHLSKNPFVPLVYGTLGLLGIAGIRELRRFPIASKLSILLIVTALGPFLIYSSIHREHLAERDRKAAERALIHRAERLASTLDTGLARLEDSLYWLTDDPSLTEALIAGGELEPILERWLRRAIPGHHRAWATALIIDSSGSERGRLGAGPAVAADSKTVIEAGEHLWIVLSARIQGRSEQLALVLNPELLRAWLTHASRDLPRFRITEALNGGQRVLLRGGHLGENDARTPAPTTEALVPSTGWSVELLDDGEHELDNLAAVERRDRLIVLLLMALTTTIAYLLGRRFAAALTNLDGAMRRFTAGESAVRAEITRDDDLGVLASRFNLLATQIGGLLREQEADAGALRDEIAEGQRKEERLRVLNAELAAARDQALAANRAKSTFLAQMSHELRTPLNAIIGYTEMVLEELQARGLVEAEEDLRKVLQAAHHLLGIISDILDLSKIEAGKHELTIREFDAVELVHEVADTAQPLMNRNQNRLVITSRVQSVPMRSDRIKLRQSLLNLVSNAAKFTRKGQVTVIVDVHPIDGCEWLTLAVRDDGIGIPNGKISQLFEPFTQVDSSPTRRFDGTGLGLAITRRFCRMLGGDVSVDSQLGKGSTFVIRVPTRTLRSSSSGHRSAALR